MAYPVVRVVRMASYPHMGAYARTHGYARETGRPEPRELMATGRAGRRRLGQSLVDDIGALFTPNPGGGSVTVDGTTQYVNSAGVDQSSPDPNAGATINPFSTVPGTHFDPLAVASEDVQGVAASTPILDLFVKNPQDPNPKPTLPGWLLPVGIGAAVLVVAKILL